MVAEAKKRQSEAKTPVVVKKEPTSPATSRGSTSWVVTIYCMDEIYHPRNRMVYRC